MNDEAGQEFHKFYQLRWNAGQHVFDRDDFQRLFSRLFALGTAVSECSRDVLRNIERTVKTTIRRRNVERSQ